MKLAKKLKKLLRNKGIIDIIIIGSYSKGRINSNDIDLIILSEKKSFEIKKQIDVLLNKKTDIQFLSLKDFDKGIPRKVQWNHDLTKAYELLEEPEFLNLIYMHWVMQFYDIMQS